MDNTYFDFFVGQSYLDFLKVELELFRDLVDIVFDLKSS